MIPPGARVLVVATVLALAGCSSVVPEATPSASSSSSAEAAVSGPPTPRVPLPCGAFGAVIANTMQVEGSLLEEKWMALNVVENFAGLQAGELSCFWGSSASGPWEAPWLGLQIMPDAAEAFAAQTPATAPELEEADLLGPGSRLHCAQEVGAECEMSFLADGYWVFAWLHPSSEPADDVPASRALMLAAGRDIGDLLAAAGPPKAGFVVATDALEAWGDCGELEADGSLAVALDAPGLALQGETPREYRAMGDDLGDVVSQRANLARCSWGSPDDSTSDVIYVSVAILPGGGWALGELSPSDPDEVFTPITVAGADRAVLTCSDSAGCDLGALVDGSYLFVHLYFVEQPHGDRNSVTVAAAEHLVAALTTSR